MTEFASENACDEIIMGTRGMGAVGNLVFMDELSSGLAMAGFVMLLMEFITSGRFRAVSDPVGIDLMMRFHQLQSIRTAGH